jgi:hypothetical protein
MFPPEERDTLVCAVRAADVVKAPAEEVIDIAPPDESIAAVLLVNAPEPDKVMFPVAVTGPETATVEPPLIETTPLLASMAAVPE